MSAGKFAGIFLIMVSILWIQSTIQQKPRMNYVGVKIINDRCITTWVDDRGETSYEGNEPILSDGKRECAGG